MTLRTNQVVLFCKTETTYGTVPTLDPSTASAIVANVTDVDPASTEWVKRNNVQPFMGNKGSVKASEHTEITVDIELTGSGTPGELPNFDPLLRSIGLAATVTENTDVLYTPVSRGLESATIWYYLDGLLHVFRGTRATLDLAWNSRQIGSGSFKFTGLRGVFSDAPLPSGVSYRNFVMPVAVNEENTVGSLHGINSPIETVSISWGAQVEYENRINQETVSLNDREPTGSITIDNNLLALKNWYQVSSSGTTGLLSLDHGTQPGNIIQLRAPQTKLTTVKPGDRNKTSTLAIGLELLPSPAGNDELSLRFL